MIFSWVETSKINPVWKNLIASEYFKFKICMILINLNSVKETLKWFKK